MRPDLLDFEVEAYLLGKFAEKAEVRSRILKTLLLAFLFLSPATFSAEVCKEGDLHHIGDLRRFGCNLEVMTAECKKWFKENPDTLEYAKDCKNILDQSTELETIATTCVETLGELWTDLWNQLVLSFEKKAEFYNLCEDDPSLECKKQLARESYYLYDLADKAKKNPEEYAGSYEEALRDTSTLDLLNKRDHVRALALRDANYKAQLENAGVPLPEPKGRNFPLEALVAVGLRSLEEMGVKARCYNSKGQARLVCYALGSIVDPTMVVGGAGLAIKSGSLVVKGESAALKLGKAAADTGATSAKSAKEWASHVLRGKGKPNSGRAFSKSKTPEPMAFQKVKAAEWKAKELDINPEVRKTISERGVVTYQLYDSNNKQVAFLEHKQGAPDSTNIEMIYISDNYKGKGVSEYLFAEMLKRNPNVKKVGTLLGGDNNMIAKKVLDSGGSCEDAIRKTPAYKIRAKFGFTILKNVVCEPYKDNGKMGAYIAFEAHRPE